MVNAHVDTVDNPVYKLWIKCFSLSQYPKATVHTHGSGCFLFERTDWRMDIHLLDRAGLAHPALIGYANGVCIVFTAFDWTNLCLLAGVKFLSAQAGQCGQGEAGFVQPNTV